MDHQPRWRAEGWERGGARTLRAARPARRSARVSCPSPQTLARTTICCRCGGRSSPGGGGRLGRSWKRRRECEAAEARDHAPPGCGSQSHSARRPAESGRARTHRADRSGAVAIVADFLLCTEPWWTHSTADLGDRSSRFASKSRACTARAVRARRATHDTLAPAPRRPVRPPRRNDRSLELFCEIDETARCRLFDPNLAPLRSLRHGPHL